MYNCVKKNIKILYRIGSDRSCSDANEIKIMIKEKKYYEKSDEGKRNGGNDGSGIDGFCSPGGVR